MGENVAPCWSCVRLSNVGCLPAPSHEKTSGPLLGCSLILSFSPPLPPATSSFGFFLRLLYNKHTETSGLAYDIQAGGVDVGM